MMMGIGARCVSRRFLTGGRILNEEVKAAQNGIVKEKEGDAYDTMALSKIDRTVKEYAYNLVHALGGVSSLSQMESRTQNLESSVDDLKEFVEKSHDSTEGKLRQLENMMREIIEHEKLEKLACKGAGPKLEEPPAAASLGDLPVAGVMMGASFKIFVKFLAGKFL